MTCKHGYDSLCPECRKDDKRIEREGVKSGAWIYCVVNWRGDNKYSAKDAVKTFKNKPAAEKYAEKLNSENQGVEHGYVVRTLQNKTGASMKRLAKDMNKVSAMKIGDSLIVSTLGKV